MESCTTRPRVGPRLLKEELVVMNRKRNLIVALAVAAGVVSAPAMAQEISGASPEVVRLPPAASSPATAADVSAAAPEASVPPPAAQPPVNAAGPEANKAEP